MHDVFTTFILDQDIDECDPDAYYCIRENSVNCTNSDGSYTCLCNTGNCIYIYNCDLYYSINIIDENQMSAFYLN